MAESYTLPLDAPGTDLATVGGKAASLGTLAQAGLPVPPGLSVTTRAYCDCVSNGLTAERIVRAFNRFPMPERIAAAVRSEYSALDSPVAVRSSVTAEDLPDASFAGQYDTFLNVTGADAVLDAVRRCWASLRTSRAMSYRALNNIAPQDVAVAGVMFTADPVTGARDTVVINAARGLGESVVAGLTTPDIYTFVDGKLRRQVNDKNVMTVPTAGGVAQEPVSESLRTAAALTDAEAAELGRRVEALSGTPMDVEWSVHDGQIATLRARRSPACRSSARAGRTCANLWEAVPSSG